ncbi:MAG: hypothetical protein ACYS83_10665 [Planctomycetota bacterium]|jgi:transposase
MACKKTPKERYLKIPYPILNLEQISFCEKVLLAHIYSFGVKGCYQSNTTLAEMFMVSQVTISRWIQNILKAGFIQIKCPKGYHRTLWASSHPDVRAAAKQWAQKDRQTGHTSSTPLTQNDTSSDSKCESDCIKSAFPLPTKCATTNNSTIKETIKATTATPSPLPAGGQAPALLKSREQERIARIERFKRGFGTGRKRRQSLTEKKFENRRQKQLAALRAT